MGRASRVVIGRAVSRVKEGARPGRSGRRANENENEMCVRDDYIVAYFLWKSSTTATHARDGTSASAGTFSPA